MDDGVSSILFLIFVIFSAFFSSMDTAIFSISPLRLKKMEGEGDKRASALLKILADRQRLFITLLIGNTFCNVASTSIAVGLFYNHLAGHEAYWSWANNSQILASVIYAAISMVFILVLFGEIIPKTVAIYGSYSYVCFTYRILRMIMFLSEVLFLLNMFFCSLSLLSNSGNLS